MQEREEGKKRRGKEDKTIIANKWRESQNFDLFHFEISSL